MFNYGNLQSYTFEKKLFIMQSRMWPWWAEQSHISCSLEETYSVCHWESRSTKCLGYQKPCWLICHLAGTSVLFEKRSCSLRRGESILSREIDWSVHLVPRRKSRSSGFRVVVLQWIYMCRLLKMHPLLWSCDEAQFAQTSTSCPYSLFRPPLIIGT